MEYNCRRTDDRMNRAVLVRVAACLCVLLSASDAAAQLARRVYASGFSSPVAFVQDPTDRTVQFVVQQGGLIRVVRSGVVQPANFLDLAGAIATGGERGLLGMAFAPDYATSRRFFVNFTNTAGHTVVARFNRSASNALLADEGTRLDLLWSTGARFITQPETNHNGGNLAFGPDGFLYIGMGDGGGAYDPGGNAQNMTSLLGKMLRIDVSVPNDDTKGFRIPADNPYRTTVRPEIWDIGLRNPWRYSFDDVSRGGTGALIIADVGQGAWEEIDYEPRGIGGRNYGWVNQEGTHAVTNRTPPPPPPAFQPLTDPIHEYDHPTGISVTGGFVYRGTALGAAFRGRYFFADLNGRVWSLGLSINSVSGAAQVVNVTEHTAQLAPTVTITSFGVDADGELYYTDFNGGRILAIALGGVPAITTQPASITRVAGQLVSLSAAATGTPTPTVQWQVSSDGGSTFVNIPGATTTLLTFRTAAADNGRRYRAVFTNSAGVATSNAAVLTIRPRAPGDMDDDFRTDLVVWRPGPGTWFTLTSGSGYSAARATDWGSEADGDVPLLGDVDGDGVQDFIVWNAPTGTWSWLTSLTGYAPGSSGSKQWGNASLGDVPLVGDLDGDGRSDLVIWRASSGTFFWLTSSSGYAYTAARQVQWGNESLGDRPMLGDFDGDGVSDPAVWRASTGTWFWLLSSRGYATNASGLQQWGNADAGDTPLVGDMDGDGRSDLVVWRASSGTWFWLRSSTQYAYASALGVQWGNAALLDRPLLGDFDGDGRSDVAVWRGSDGTWFCLTSSTGFDTSMGFARQWGSPSQGDIPMIR